jgi:hypothetical protein
LAATLVVGSRCVPDLVAQANEPVSFREVEFASLTERDPNPLGEKALAIHPDQWKHGETDHFIYHFVHTFVATPISAEAEFAYRVITKEFDRDLPASSPKCHVYIFEPTEDWQQFQASGHLERWTGGIHSAGSLFIHRNPANRFSDNRLAHEITHLIIHRYYSAGIPCWLDEGFAQYVSKNAHSAYQRARGYMAKPHSEAIAAGDFISLTTLLAYTQPPSDRVETFYDESERLVRFLAGVDKPRFLGLLDALGRHQPFELALQQHYAGVFQNTSALEHKFQDYAVKDFGTSLQQITAE